MVSCFSNFDGRCCKKIDEGLLVQMSCTPNTIFSEVFSCKRFLQILCVLYFVDNSSVPLGPHSDRIWKIRLIFDFLVDKFSDIFMPGKNFCINESLLLWKGRLFQAVYPQEMQ